MMIVDEKKIRNCRILTIRLLRQKRNISLLKRFPRFMLGSKGSSLRDEEKSVIENG